MTDQKITDILATMVAQNATTRLPTFQRVSGISQALLANAGLQEPYSADPNKGKKDPRGPSFVNRVIDVMSRPLYASLNAVKGGWKRSQAKGGDVSDQLGNAAIEGARMLSPLTNPEMMNDLWRGFSGQDKTTGRDILSETKLDANMGGPQKFLSGLALDIVADPLTYVGGIGLTSKLGKGAIESTEALANVERGAAVSSQEIASQLSRKAADQANKLGTIVPEKGLAAPKPNDPPRLFQAGPGPNNISEIDALKAPEPNLAPPPPRQPIAALTAGPQATQISPLEALSESLSRTPTGRGELNKLKEISVTDKPQDVLRILNEKIAAARSPIAKNLLRKEAEKIQAGVKPADILSEARVTPQPFPEITIQERWINAGVEAARKFLSNNRLKNINHVGQTNLYNAVLNAASKVRKDRRAFTVLQMLRAAEDEVLASGRHLVDAEGLSVRLSDVANMAGGKLTPKLVDDFRKARPSQQVEDLKAFTTPQVASEILEPVIKTGEDIATGAKELPPSRTVMLGSTISKELGKLAEQAGASSREAGTAKRYIDELFDPSRDRLYSIPEQEARSLLRQSSTGIVDPHALQKVSSDIYKLLEANPKVLGKQVNQSKVVEGIMTKFGTWWNAKDLKPFSREYIDTARNVAAAFAETMTPLVRSTTATQRAKAWTVATGKLSPSDPAEAQLAEQFKYLIERLLGTHGVANNSESVLTRSGTLMKELNDELPQGMKFIDKKGYDDLGKAYDYSDKQWMHSWKEWKVKEPAEALYQLTRTLQLVTRKNAMWDDAAARWGMPIKNAEFQHVVKHIPRLTGTYFPKQIAEQLDGLQRQLDRDIFRAPGKAIKIFDQVQRMWKTGVTIYSPSHHIRNLNGDIYLAALDGVVSPRPYAIATKVLHAYPTRYKDLESVFNIMDPKLRDSVLTAKPGNVVLTTKRGERVTAEQLYRAAESQGLFVRAMHAEDLVGDAAPAFGTFGAKFQPFGGRVYGAASRVSELRDHWVRLAHFADVLTKSRQPLRISIEQAGRRVKKFHPDGMDLTGFEQNVLRRVIPFYSWMRKATPLVLEGALMRPHITLAFPKVMSNMQLMTGIESEGPSDPFPMDQMFPDWIREKGIGPILQPGSGLGRDANWRGEAPGYTVVNPTQPFMDQIIQLGSPGKTLTSSLTPAARIPIELMTGQTSLGIPLENVEGGTSGYLAQQIPAVGIGARLTGATRDNEPWNPEQLLNWLTSAGISGTGPYQSQAQQELMQEIAAQAKKNRGDYR